jgi:hypothetical protein
MAASVKTLLMFLFGGGGVVAILARQVFKGAMKVAAWGDELGGWTLFTGRRPTVRGMARFAFRCTVAVLVLVGLVLAARRWPNVGATLGVALVGAWNARLLILAGLVIGLGWALWLRAARFMGDEPWTAEGLHRAREHDIVRTATRQAVTSYMQADRPVRLRSWVRATTTAIASEPIEFGWLAVVEAPDMTSAMDVMRKAGGGIGDDLSDGLAAQITRNIKTLSRDTRRGRALRRRKGYRLPTIQGTAANHLPWDGMMDPSIATITVRLFDPFGERVDHPYGVGVALIDDIDEPLPVGVERDGTVATIRLGGRNTLVTGSTGSGKSSLFGPILRTLFYVRNVAPVLIDLKGGAEFGPAARRAAVVITEADEAAIAIQWATGVAVRRAAAARLTIVSDDCPAFPVFIDEAQVLGEPTITEDMTDAELTAAERHAARRMGMIAPLVKRCRSAGMPVVIVTQYSRSDVLNVHVTSQCRNRIAGRMMTRTQAEVAVGELPSSVEGPHRIPDSDDYNGVLYGRFGDGPMRYVRGWYVTAEELAAHAKATAFYARRLASNPDLVELQRRLDAHRAGRLDATAMVEAAEVDATTTRREARGKVALDELPPHVVATIEQCFADAKPVRRLPKNRLPLYSSVVDVLRSARDSATNTDLDRRIVAALDTLGEPVEPTPTQGEAA